MNIIKYAIQNHYSSKNENNGQLRIWIEYSKVDS
jgi:hypothetical protein